MQMGIAARASCPDQKRPAVVNVPGKQGWRYLVAGVLPLLVFATTAAAQVGYTFTSGPLGDGFNWPASPTGLLPDDYFITPDGVEFYNYIGNNLFFDSQYQVAGNAPGITDEAVWGNPKEDGYGSVDILFFNYGSPQSVEFDFAWSVAGGPFETPDYVYVYLEDSEGRVTEVATFLSNVFTGFGGFDGYADRLGFNAADLYDDYEYVDGGQFVDIAYMSIWVYEINTLGGTSEFAIDNLEVDGGVGGGELFPSVNGGAIDVTGSILGRTVLRGTGAYGVNMEVTNGTTSDTTYSTQLVPGGELTDLGQVSGAPILAGQTLATPNIVSIDRSSPSKTYDSEVILINDLDPFDPDNMIGLRVRLFEAPSLTTPSPVDVTAGQKVQLANAAAPVNGHRASVKVSGTSLSGPFPVTGFAVGAPVKPGEMIEGDAALDRFGQLSGNYSGTLSVALEMTAFAGVNNDIEVFLAGAEPVPDAQWTLEAVLADIPGDSAAYASGAPLGPGVVGVNSASTAATLLAGTTTGNGNVSMTLGTVLPGTSTVAIGQGAQIDFSTAVPIHVVQMTYREADICPDIPEANLRLLHFDGGFSDWQLAVDGNSGGSSTFFAGSFQDFVATLGGAPLSSALGTHGADPANNHVWAILNHEGLFGIGAIGQSCLSPADFDRDGDVDMDDLDRFEDCASGPAIPLSPGCDDRDFDNDSDVDQSDFAVFQRCYSGDRNPGDPNCAD